MKGVDGIEVNVATGSVIVHHDPSLHDDFHEQLANGSSAGAFLVEGPELSEVDELAKKIEAEAEFLAQHSESARIIVDAFKNLHQTIKRATRNAVDLKVILPLGLAAYSLVEFGLEASTPVWSHWGSSRAILSLPCIAPPPGVHARSSRKYNRTGTAVRSARSEPGIVPDAASD
jgi:hypothetical protein